MIRLAAVLLRRNPARNKPIDAAAKGRTGTWSSPSGVAFFGWCIGLLSYACQDPSAGQTPQRSGHRRGISKKMVSMAAIPVKHKRGYLRSSTIRHACGPLGAAAGAASGVNSVTGIDIHNGK